MTGSMRYYIIAGEASGDLHGSNLMKGLYSEDPHAVIRFWGGDLMEKVFKENRPAHDSRTMHDNRPTPGKPGDGDSPGSEKHGAGLVRHYREGAIMGFWEVFAHASRLLGNIKFCKKDILRFRPDAVILIDYPGFNFKIAEFAHRHGLKVFYYIAPKVWASREGRIRKLKEYVDKLFIVFPFEIPYFRNKGVDFIYRGNPLVDAIDDSKAANESRQDFLRRNNLPDKPIIAMLAGSRKGEISTMMPVLTEFACRMASLPRYRDWQFIIAGAPARSTDDYQPWLQKLKTEGTCSGTGHDTCTAPGIPDVKVIFGQTQEIVRNAEAAVVNSGTASLETALLGTPQAVGFIMGSRITYAIARKIVKVKYISLGNLIADRLVFKEFIQDDCNADNLVREIRSLIEDGARREEMLEGYREIRKALGGKGASSAVAREMTALLKDYNPASGKAGEFICDREILDTIEYARIHKNDRKLVESILDKAEECRGLDHREAAVLMECDEPDLLERMFSMAKELKQRLYGNRIVMFAPLYLSDWCVNGCTYCPYHARNTHIPRKKLSQEEIRKEVTALQDMGHKRLAIEAGEDPVHNPIEYILESIATIYGTHHRNGAIRRVNVNIAATTVENYRKLKDAGIGTYILFQETYNRKNYEALHPSGPKSDYEWHTEAMDRAMEGGIDDVGIGVLFGLDTWRYDLTGLLMHAEHLEAKFGVGPHTISVPRICPADDIDTGDFPNAVPDEIFCRIVAVIRLAVPYTGMIISTRESEKVRAKVLGLGISQISGGSRTSVGGYSSEGQAEDTAQFDISDRRSLDEVVGWLLDLGYIPSFCTACYREGRTGDRFMSLVKRGKIADCCQPNALMTLMEYLQDYASPRTKARGMEAISRELENIGSPKVRELTEKHLREIAGGQRDFRF